MVRALLALFSAVAATGTGHQYTGAHPNGACGGTSAALSALCSESTTWGVCHAWTDASDANLQTNSDATYRGAWINELIFTQEYRAATSAADASAMSRIRVTTPALAGLHSCDSDFAAQGELLKNGHDQMKFVDVSVGTVWAGIISNTSFHAEGSAVTNTLPILPAPYLGNGAATAAATTGNAWGRQYQSVDTFGLRNSLIVKYQPNVGQTLPSYMIANIITKDGTAISAIGLGDEVVRNTRSVDVSPAKVLNSGTVKLTCVASHVASLCLSRLQSCVGVRFRDPPTREGEARAGCAGGGGGGASCAHMLARLRAHTPSLHTHHHTRACTHTAPRPHW